MSEKRPHEPSGEHGEDDKPDSGDTSDVSGETPRRREDDSAAEGSTPASSLVNQGQSTEAPDFAETVTGELDSGEAGVDAEQVAPPPPPEAPPFDPMPLAPRKSIDERKEALARAVASQLRLGNRRIETQSDFNAVIVFGQPVNHLLHAVITIFSCGLWGIVWLVLALSGGEKREMIVVDEYGNTSVQQLT